MKNKLIQHIKTEHQVGGTHYNACIELWDFIEEEEIGYIEGCILKYVVRYKNKGGIIDLKKALHYIKKLIELSQNGRKSRSGHCSYVSINLICKAYKLSIEESRIFYLLCKDWNESDLQEALLQIIFLIENMLESGKL